MVNKKRTRKTKTPAHARLSAISPAGLSTEQRILSAARQEFCERGVDGARMQAIADRADVNKALLHYYFRSKEKLFEVIIRGIITDIWQDINRDLGSGSQTPDLRSAIKALVYSYVTAFSRQPEIPMIIMRLLITRDKSFELAAQHIIDAVGDGPKRLFSLFEKERRAGRIKRVDPIQLVMSIMGMIIITFICRPIAEVLQQKTGMTIAFNDTFYRSRVEFITDLVFDGIKEYSR